MHVYHLRRITAAVGFSFFLTGEGGGWAEGGGVLYLLLFALSRLLLPPHPPHTHTHTHIPPFSTGSAPLEPSQFESGAT